MQVHLELSGQWAMCPAGCADLPYHFPVAELTTLVSMPEVPFWQLMTAVQEPDFINPAGQMTWREAHVLHRDYDLPAFIDEYEGVNSLHEWWQAGALHRDGDKPAQVYGNSRKTWYQHGVKHRELGLPAVIYSDGTEEFWYEGEQMSAATAKALRTRFITG